MKRNSALVLGVGAIAGALLLSGCTATGASTSSSTVSAAAISKAMSTPTTITFWTWVPGIASEVALFEKKYPKIKVDLVNAGQGNAEYTKLQTAVDAHKGAPDVVQLEYSELPSFEVSNSLLNLNPYGAQSLKSDFSPGPFAAVTNAGQVEAVPQDAGPMTFMYRKDILAQAGVKAPTTWAEFATAAATVKSKTGSSLIDLAPGDGSEMLGLLQEAGANPFQYDGKKTVTIDLQSPQVKQVADYLTKLVQSGNVAIDPDFTNDWYQGFAKGNYAGWLVGAWGPDDLLGSVAGTSGKWTVAPLPEWTAGTAAGGDWGGSSDAVVKTSKNPIAAYEFAKFVNDDPTSASLLTFNPKTALFPTKTAVLNSSKFSGEQIAFLDGQKGNQVFASIAKTVNPNFGYLPYMNYANTQYGSTVGAAVTAKTDLYTAFGAWQKLLVAYGKQQGFTVKTS
jgi:multiple sugar transport system substrate-binding protein